LHRGVGHSNAENVEAYFDRRQRQERDEKTKKQLLAGATVFKIFALNNEDGSKYNCECGFCPKTCKTPW
jgi:hypothetical protein